jgi:hypothetical protein
MTARYAGVYRVYHYAHRAPHEVFVPSRAVLPKCHRCGDRVQFAPLLFSDRYDTDVDLDGETGGNAA